MAKTRILDVSLLKLPQDIDLPRPGPTIPLSFLDLWWVPTPPVKNLFLYPNFSLSSFPSFKSSLSVTLPFFHPFAGQLTMLPSSSLSICCSSDTGALFIEAESDIDVTALAHDPTHDMESYNQLIPNISRERLPLPMLAVQITKFVRGGTTIGIAMHHTAMDATGLQKFFDVWCAVHRGETVEDAVGREMPVHDRGVIVLQGRAEISRRLVKMIAPELPKIGRRLSDNTLESRRKIVRKSFLLDAISIQFLKQQVVQKTSTYAPIPSTFQVVTAYIWTCTAKTKGLHNNNNLTFLCFVNNCRNLLNPPVPSAYTGNYVHRTVVDLAGSVLASKNGFVHATIATALAVEEAKNEPLKGVENIEAYMSLPKGLKVFVSGILRFYDVDFGSGRPERMEVVVENEHDVKVYILAGKEKGTIQVSLGLPKCEIEKFTSIFVEGLDGAKYCKL